MILLIKFLKTVTKMTDPLVVVHLNKKYPSFALNNVSFRVKAGHIMGFIGRNGAGKSTTLKSILNLVHPDSGQITYFGQNLFDHETEIKAKIGFADGNVVFYQKKKIRDLLAITKSFYKNWDEAACQHYLKLFALDLEKRPDDLSAGMRVKLNLLIALSHHAQLLILDEPTSGLDPVSRNELLKNFGLLKKQGIAILFSTHITTDLENCADDITYISHGQIVASESIADFLQHAQEKQLGNNIEEIMVNYEERRAVK